MSTLVDSSVLLDVLAPSPWREWSEEHLALAAEPGELAINQVISAEIAAGFTDRGQLERTLQGAGLMRVGLPWAAAWLVARAFREYRGRGGPRTAPLPDFFIGAHAEAARLPLLTRDAARIRIYCPEVALLAPA